MGVIIGLFVLCALVTDVRYRKIPNWIVLTVLLLGMIWSISTGGGMGFLNSVLGIFVGGLLLIFPYIFGGLGAGDVKLLGAIGAFLWPRGILNCFIMVAFAGGIVALLSMVLKRRLKTSLRKIILDCSNVLLHRSVRVMEVECGENTKENGIPYAIPIFLGFVFYICFYGKLI